MPKYITEDFDFTRLYDDEGNYIHTEVCGTCGEEVSYTTDPLVAVACPTDGCDGYFIHCDACLHQDVDWGRGSPPIPCVDNCPWRQEACPETGALVMIHDDRPDDHKALCPCGCGMEFTVFDHRHSWE